MSGERPFDDDRWPDAERFACCFMCGRKIDPLDPTRGSYTMRADSCEPLPVHLPCVDGVDDVRIQVPFMAALNEMGDANAKKAMEAADIRIVPRVFH